MSLLKLWKVDRHTYNRHYNGHALYNWIDNISNRRPYAERKSGSAYGNGLDEEIV